MCRQSSLSHLRGIRARTKLRESRNWKSPSDTLVRRYCFKWRPEPPHTDRTRHYRLLYVPVLGRLCSIFRLIRNEFKTSHLSVAQKFPSGFGWCLRRIDPRPRHLRAVPHAVKLLNSQRRLNDQLGRKSVLTLRRLRKRIQNVESTRTPLFCAYIIPICYSNEGIMHNLFKLVKMNR